MQWPYATPCDRHSIMIKFSNCEEGKLSMVKLLRFAKLRENHESFPPLMFCCIWYLLATIFVRNINHYDDNLTLLVEVLIY